jgi:hypothetical protein
VQKKVIKENHTPLPLHPSVLAPHMGGCGTRFAQTVLAAFHLLAQAEGATKGMKVKNKPCDCQFIQKRCSERRMDIGLQGRLAQQSAERKESKAHAAHASRCVLRTKVHP